VSRNSTLSRSILLAVVLGLVLGLATQAASVTRHGSREKPWVALTFDDGWDIDRCARIVRTLRARRAPATFFINGAVMRRDPERWRRLLKGFEIANHTLSHRDLSRLDPAGIRSQIVRNERVIERILGRPMLRLLRPSYGAFDADVLRIAAALGYQTILWDTDGGDGRAGTRTRSIIADGSRGDAGAIVLLHCGPSATPAAVGRIIERYRKRGLRLVDLGTMLDPDPPASACRVVNDRTGKTDRSLQQAVRSARSGDRLILRGTCLGPATIRRDVEIAGTQSGESGLPTVYGVGMSSALTVGAGATVTLKGLTVSGGIRGVENRGHLTLVDGVVQGNGVAELGAGVYNAAGATLVLRGSTTIRRNTASVAGGGVFNAGTLLLREQSSIVRNVVRDLGLQLARAGDDTETSALPSPLLDAIDRPGGGILDMGRVSGAVCAPAADANVQRNSPDDCRSAGERGSMAITARLVVASMITIRLAVSRAAHREGS
jgi:peptidoglycan/xylan/chitin deacetylase (PgdA/CDA1 family)